VKTHAFLLEAALHQEHAALDARAAELAAIGLAEGVDYPAIAAKLAPALLAAADEPIEGFAVRIARPDVAEVVRRGVLVLRYTVAGRFRWAAAVARFRTPGRIVVVCEEGDATTITEQDPVNALGALLQVAEAMTAARAARS
jgi:hypothetical protein